MSMNEELQSTNEELESSREELQSMNEELSTVNAQLQEKVNELTDVNADLTNFLVASDIATVFIDADLRVSRFTAGATRLLNLVPSDVGRPIGHLATNLVDFDLPREVETVLDSHEPSERAVQARDGRHYVIRVLPYDRAGDSHGVVVTLADVTALKASQQELRLLNQTLEEQIRDRSRRLSFPHDLARRAAEAPTWDEALRDVLRRICTTEKWQIGYVYVPSDGSSTELTEAIEYLENERFALFHKQTPDRVTRNEGPAARAYAEGRLIWFDDQEALVRAIPASTDAIQEIGLRSGVGVPLSFGGQTVAVLELFSTAPNRSSDDMHSLLIEVSSQVGVVLDRVRTMNHAAAMVWDEQQNLVHTLHDLVGQQLTAIALLSAGLSKKIKGADSDAGIIVKQIGQLAQTSTEQVRQLARGLFPIEVDGDVDGLRHALGRLASTTSSLGAVKCTVEEDGTVPVRDTRVATELYRIAQEAVTNALRHADARNIVIRLAATDGSTTLTVTDDGRGLSNKHGDKRGIGLRIMRYRAQSIGASVTVESKPDQGTVVSCQVRDKLSRLIFSSGPVSEG
jgi:two-component system CheB/CheR fusion protein